MDEALSKRRYEAYREAIRSRVCSACLDTSNDGNCGLTKRTCAIEAHLPAVIEAILPIQSGRMDEYVAAIEAQICRSCGGQDPSGVCRLRDQADCALYSFLPLVVEAVEEVHEAERRAAGMV